MYYFILIIWFILLYLSKWPGKLLRNNFLVWKLFHVSIYLLWHVDSQWIFLFCDKKLHFLILWYTKLILCLESIVFEFPEKNDIRIKIWTLIIIYQSWLAVSGLFFFAFSPHYSWLAILVLLFHLTQYLESSLTNVGMSQVGVGGFDTHEDKP